MSIVGAYGIMSLPTLGPVVKAYVCATCGKQYQRNTHLRRHEASHSGNNKFKCLYCVKEFSRGDVCRKHVSTCPKKDASLLQPEQRRGRKPTACEACYHSKVSCDKKIPCSRCISRKIPCHARDIVAEMHYNADSASVSSSGTGISGHANTAQSPDPSFMLGAIDPNLENMLDYFTTGTGGDDQQMEDEFSNMGSDLHPYYTLESMHDPATTAAALSSLSTSPSGPISLISQQHQMQLQQEQQQHSPAAVDDFFGTFPPNYGPLLDDILRGFNGDVDLSPSNQSPLAAALTDEGYEVLEAKSRSIIHELHTLHCGLFSNTVDYSTSFNPAEAEVFLGADKMRKFTETYFRSTKANLSIIHQPTFGTEETSSVLLLAVVMAGAFHSAPIDDAIAVRNYFTLVEEYVFREVDRLMMSQNAILPPSLEVLQALQAGVTILYLMLLNNNVPTRRRARSQRLPKLIAAVRYFGLSTTRHALGLDWYKFIYQETCIRVATWTAIADWHHAGLFYYPPVMTVSEMACNFPCARELWDAPDLTTYIIRRENLDTTPSAPALGLTKSIKEFTTVLMDENWTQLENMSLKNVTIESLYAVVISLSAMTISACQMMTLPKSAPTILRAITRWQHIWDQVTSKADAKSLRRAGMARHANENCDLMRTIIQAGLTGATHPYFQTIGHDSLQELHGFISQAGAAGSAVFMTRSL